MPPGWDRLLPSSGGAGALEHQPLPGRHSWPGQRRNRSRSLTTADSCRDARRASVSNLGPRLHLILPGARRRDAGLVGYPLTPGRRRQTPDLRTGSFDSIGRVPWGPRSFSGRWSQRRARPSPWIARLRPEIGNHPERERDPQGRKRGNDASSWPGQLHPRTALPERDSPGGRGGTADAASVSSLTHLPAIGSTPRRGPTSRGLSGTRSWQQGPGSNPGVLHPSHHLNRRMRGT